jgi:RNA polymerase sigma-70 factor (ECF subfamily)
VTTPLQRIVEPAVGSLTEGAVVKGVVPSKRESLDAESIGWLRALSGTGRKRDDAVERLHALVLRAARFEVARRRLVMGGSADSNDLALQAADDALVAIMSKLHTYRGDSRFTTWTYKFVVLEAAVRVRKRSWERREVPLEDDGLAHLVIDRRASPAGQAEASEQIRASATRSSAC